MGCGASKSKLRGRRAESTIRRLQKREEGKWYEVGAEDEVPEDDLENLREQILSLKKTRDQLRGKQQTMRTLCSQIDESLAARRKEKTLLQDQTNAALKSWKALGQLHQLGAEVGGGGMIRDHTNSHLVVAGAGAGAGANGNGDLGLPRAPPEVVEGQGRPPSHPMQARGAAEELADLRQVAGALQSRALAALEGPRGGEGPSPSGSLEVLSARAGVGAGEGHGLWVEVDCDPRPQEGLVGELQAGGGEGARCCVVATFSGRPGGAADLEEFAGELRGALGTPEGTARAAQALDGLLGGRAAACGWLRGGAAVTGADGGARLEIRLFCEHDLVRALQRDYLPAPSHPATGGKGEGGGAEGLLEALAARGLVGSPIKVRASAPGAPPGEVRLAEAMAGWRWEARAPCARVALAALATPSPGSSAAAAGLAGRAAAAAGRLAVGLCPTALARAAGAWLAAPAAVPHGTHHRDLEGMEAGPRVSTPDHLGLTPTPTDRGAGASDWGWGGGGGGGAGRGGAGRGRQWAARAARGTVAEAVGAASAACLGAVGRDLLTRMAGGLGELSGLSVASPTGRIEARAGGLAAAALRPRPGASRDAKAAAAPAPPPPQPSSEGTGGDPGSSGAGSSRRRGGELEEGAAAAAEGNPAKGALPRLEVDGLEVEGGGPRGGGPASSTPPVSGASRASASMGGKQVSPLWAEAGEPPAPEPPAINGAM